MSAAGEHPLLDGVPPGITVLEASAGTGKTHRVASIAVEAVASGMPLDGLLLVTFTRMATGELRDRVWRRLLDAERALHAHLATGTVPDDEVFARICDAPAADIAERHGNLASAVANFDAATIATIHGFCQQVLSRVGFAGDVELDVDFLEDTRELTGQVVDDLLVQRLHRKADLDFPRDEALRIARAVTTNPHAFLLPADAPAKSPEGTRVRFAHKVRERLERRKRELRVLGYDDLLTRLAATLEGPHRTVVRDRLQEQYRLVVVDEFQDTDTVQWRILREAFAGGTTRLVLIGDPKQSIYAFRGADVHAYLAARRLAAGEDTLDTCWRSDAGVLQALDAVFADATLGHDEIAYRRTTAAPNHTEPRLVDGVRCDPMRIRVLRRDQADAILTPKSGDLQERWAREHIVADLTADVVRRLSDGSCLVDRSADGTETGRRRVEPRDIGVLVQRNRDAEQVRDALAAAGVPAVVNAGGDVFASDAAQDWLTLLEAIEQPAATTRVRSAALTPFLGWQAAELAIGDDERWDQVHARLHDWRTVLAGHGMAALFERICATTGLPARLLREVGGERRLTDLRHVMELLHAHASHVEAGPATLVSHLRERIREAEGDEGTDERSRRLETDADAVQVWTIHRSKGLEFPIVYLPFLWKPGWIPEDAIPVFHAGDDDARFVDVGGKRPGWRLHHQLHRGEQRGEELRLAYVAMTRPRSQVVLWWAPTYSAFESPLGRLLFARAAADGILDETPPDDRARTILDVLANDAGGAVRIEDAVGGDDATFRPDDRPAPELAVRRFDRGIDRAWRRTSYSALTAVAHDAPTAHGPATAPEHDDRGLEDERMPADVVAERSATGGDDALEQVLRDVPSPFGDLGGGARFGTLVHGVLEDVDFTAGDLRSALRHALAQQYLGGHERLDTEALLDGLVAAVETPLGPLAGGRALRQIPPGDRLDELHFELPLVGGDTPHDGSVAVTLDVIADVLAAHLPADDPLAGYADELRDPLLAASVRGHLSGAIDIVLRVDGRYVVVDHKSNWLGVEGEELSAWHYRPTALRDAMVRAHYPLQALLYAVALHRYLRWRLPDHDPDRDLGGVLYLFLRGMTGPDVPLVDGQPCGVFSWRPPAALVVGLSDALDRGTA